MRLGAPLYNHMSSPDVWARAAQERGYRAMSWPLELDAGEDAERDWLKAAQDADLVIAEVGAWSNPLSNDAAERKAAVEKCCQSLALADRVGARCCVNIAGSRGAQWDGPHPTNLSSETFAMIVESTRAIIDAVQPTRTCYALETMPWIFPDSPQNYLRLLEAIDRPQFGVHLDPVNMINSPERFYYNTDFLKECFRLLGPHIKGCHAKDIVLEGRLTVHLDEARPGLGGLDYATYLTELNKLDPDTPLILEHLPNAQEYDLAAEHVRSIAREQGITL